ncbi:MAG: hypothetical protein H7833_18335 [Magnetococcus sp. DMHC-1]
MGTKKKIQNRQQGSLVIVAIVLMTVLGVIGVVMSKMYVSGNKASAENVSGDKALNLAEAGTQSILKQLKDKNCDPTQLSGAVQSGSDVVVTQTIAGQGQFSATFKSTGPSQWTVTSAGTNNRRVTEFPGLSCGSSSSGSCDYGVIGNSLLSVDKNNATINGNTITACNASSSDKDDSKSGDSKSGDKDSGKSSELPDHLWKKWFGSLVIKPAFAESKDKDDGKSGGSDKSGDSDKSSSTSASCNVLTKAGKLESGTVAIPALSAFVASTEASGDVTVSSDTSRGTGEYKTVTINNNQALTFNVSGGTYKIKTLTLGNGATLNMAPGTYYISTLTANQNSKIKVTPSGVVKIYVQTADIQNNVEINKGGTVANLGIYYYTEFKSKNGADIDAVIYASSSTAKSEFDNNVKLHGSVISAGEVTLNKIAITFDAAVTTAVASLAPGVTCTGGSSSGGGTITPGSWKEKF